MIRVNLKELYPASVKRDGHLRRRRARRGRLVFLRTEASVHDTNAKLIFARKKKAVRDAECAFRGKRDGSFRRSPLGRLARGKIFFKGWFRRRPDCNRGPRNPIRRCHVFFHQQRRERENVADVVEAVPGVVGGKVVGSTKVDAQKVADRIVVFGAVEAAGGDAARVGCEVLFRHPQMPLNPIDDRSDGCRVRTRNARRRHLSPAKLFPNFLKYVSALQRRRGIGEHVQSEPLHLEFFAVAGKTVRFQERPDSGPEGRCWVFGPAGRHGKHRQLHQADHREKENDCSPANHYEKTHSGTI